LPTKAGRFRALTLATNDDIADVLVRHQIGLQRLSTATARKVLALLRRSDARLVERLAREDLSAISRARQERLLEAIRKIVDSAYTDVTGALRVDLDALSEYEVQFNADAMRRTIPVEVDFTLPTQAQVIAAVNSRPFQGRVLREWFRDLPAQAFARLRSAIRMGIVEGRTTDQIIREIRGTRANGYKDGILEIDRRHAEAAVRTAINHTATVAREKLWEGNERLLKGVQWTATLDGRTSAVCRARDGTVYPVGSGPRPPAHPNCRSSVVPVLKSWQELGFSGGDLPVGTRASMNGQVAGDVTYNDWLRRQPVEFQDDVLGVAKARLFRQGGLTLDRFVDRAGREYTLDELRRREAAAWERTFATSS
jgi:SPP1 gp7 family putative phage head morphogenesis protein